MNKVFIFFLVCLSSCTTQESVKNESNNEIQVRKQTTVSGELDTNYQCKRIDSDVICIPEGWDEERQDKYFFLSQLRDDDSNTYFVTIKEVNPNESFDKYESRVIEVSMNDSIEILKNYALTQLKYKSKRATFIEMDLDKHDNQYWAYCMLVEKNGVRYDFTLKVHHNKKEQYYEMYQSVLNSFIANGDVLFDTSEKLHAIKQIKTLD